MSSDVQRSPTYTIGERGALTGSPSVENSDAEISDADTQVNGSKKRKRSEVAVAIDHQGVNIYDVPAAEFIGL